MKVMMYSTDASAFEQGSQFRSRLAKYGRLFERLDVIVKTKPWYKNERLDNNVYLYPTNTTLKILFFLSAYRLGSQLLKESGDNYIVSTQEEFSGIVAFLLKLRFGIIWQAQIHTDLYNQYSRRFYDSMQLVRVFLSGMLLPRSSCIRVVSERVRRQITAHGITKPIFVLPIFVDSKAYKEFAERRSYEVKRRPFNFLMVSRLTKEKNISKALYALSRLVKKVPSARLTIVGNGSELDRLKKLASELEIAHIVFFEGWQNDVRPYLRDADAYVLTSFYEGYSMSVIEAMASGLPVIMTDVGIAGDILKNNQSGLVVTPGSTDELYRAMMALMGDSVLRERLGKNAFHTAMELPGEEEYLVQFKKSFELCKKERKN